MFGFLRLLYLWALSTYWVQRSQATPGGYFQQNRTWSGYACQTSKIWLSLYTNFLLNFPPISIPFSKEKHPILTKLAAFYNNSPKIHPIYVIWAPSSLMNPPDRYTTFREKAPQKADTYTYTKSIWEPPRAGNNRIGLLHLISIHPLWNMNVSL